MTSDQLRLLTEFHREAVESAQNRRLEDDPDYRRWCAAKRITWMILLAGAFLFYYLMTKLGEALAIV